MHRELRTARSAVDLEPDWRIEAQELLTKLNDVCNDHEVNAEDRLGLLEFLQARRYVSLLDHAEDLLKAAHELLDFAEGTAGDNQGRPWDWIEKARAVVFLAEGNT